ERPDAALAEDDVAVAPRQDVFGREQELLHGRRHAAFQEDRLRLLADRVQQRVVLHVPRADLETVGDYGDCLDVARRKDLGDDRKPAYRVGFREDIEALLPTTSERVRRSARFLRTSPQRLASRRV